MKREEELTVSVKSLEWKYMATPPSGEEYAPSSVGTYFIELGFKEYIAKLHSWTLGVFSSLDVAKEFCSNDFETRIRSALLSNPKPEIEPVEQRDNSELLLALSRMAGNRQSDGTSSLVSWQDREAIINGFHDLLISSRQTPKPEATEGDHTSPMTMGPETFFDEVERVVESYVGGEYEAQGCAAEKILEDVRDIRDATEGGAHEKGLREIATELLHALCGELRLNRGTHQDLINRARAALTAKQTDGREG